MYYKDGNYKGDGTFNVLVTGAAGFIGHQLVKHLRIFPNHYVIAFDNLSTGDIDNITYADPNVFYKGDLRNRAEVEEVFQKYNINLVFHLAALPKVQYSVAMPVLTNEANIVGTLNLLDVARNYKDQIERFVFSSSSSIYGNQKELPLIETMSPNPLSPYALQKLTGDIYTQQFFKLYGLKTVALRYFNVYGPRQNMLSDYAAAIPKFIAKILNNEKPLVYGDGLQTRDFTYVDDVISANLCAAYTQNEKVFGEAFNIGGGYNFSVNDIIKMINDELKTDIQPTHVDPVVESKHTLANINKMKDMTGWTPSVSFKDGLGKTIQYYKELLNRII